MKTLITHNGNLCTKRIVSLVCLVTAVVLAFTEADSTVVITFLGASFGNNALTLKG